MMRILLTGVNGQVGNALCPLLHPLGAVIAADRSVIDLARPADLPASLDEVAPDLIVNPAAYTAVDLAEDERELAYRVNAEAPGRMAQWAARRGVPMVHFSTDYVFNGTGVTPWHEDDATEPLSVYGASKLAGETAVRTAGGSHLVIRTSWVFASRGKNFLNTIARLARERSELRVVADQMGAPTSARSIAEALASILSATAVNDRKEIRGRFERSDGLVHMSNSGETSFHGFACAIVSGLRSRGGRLAVADIAPIATSDYPTRAIRPHNSRLDTGRLNAVFGLQMPDWKFALDRELDALAAAAEWQQ